MLLSHRSRPSARRTNRIRAAWMRRVLLATSWVACAGCADSRAPEDMATADGAAPVAADATLDDFAQPLPRDASDAARVVSLNPTFTEIVFAIGAGDRLVGRTQWDTRPAAALKVTNVGAGIRPNVEAVLATRPSLVLLYASADNRAAATALRRAGVRTLALRTVTIADFERATHALGVALGEQQAATVLVDSIAATLQSVRKAVRGRRRPRVVWPSWEAPVLVVANASYEAELLEIAGAENIFADRNESVAGVTLEEVAKRDPELLLASPERVLRLANSPTWRVVRAVREGRMIPLDTIVVGRPGVTIGMAAVSIARALHPDLVVPRP